MICIPFLSISSFGQKSWSNLNLLTRVTFFSIKRPVYSFVFGLHSSRTSTSPSFISKSFKRSSHFFFPDATASKYSGQIFFFIVAISYLLPASRRWCSSVFFRPQFFHFLPEPQGHGSLRPTAALPVSIFLNFDRSRPGAGADAARPFGWPFGLKRSSISNTFPRKDSSRSL